MISKEFKDLRRQYGLNADGTQKDYAETITTTTTPQRFKLLHKKYNLFLSGSLAFCSIYYLITGFEYIVFLLILSIVLYIVGFFLIAYISTRLKEKKALSELEYMQEDINLLPHDKQTIIEWNGQTIIITKKGVFVVLKSQEIKKVDDIRQVLQFIKNKGVLTKEKPKGKGLKVLLFPFIFKSKKSIEKPVIQEHSVNLNKKVEKSIKQENIKEPKLTASEISTAIKNSSLIESMQDIETIKQEPVIENTIEDIQPIESNIEKSINENHKLAINELQNYEINENHKSVINENHKKQEPIIENAKEREELTNIPLDIQEPLSQPPLVVELEEGDNINNEVLDNLDLNNEEFSNSIELDTNEGFEIDEGIESVNISNENAIIPTISQDLELSAES